MRCTGYEMARYKGTQASHLYEKSMHTLWTIQWATAPGRSLNYPRPKSITHLRTFSDNGVYVALQLFLVILVSDHWRQVLIPYSYRQAPWGLLHARGWLSRYTWDQQLYVVSEPRETHRECNDQLQVDLTILLVRCRSSITRHGRRQCWGESHTFIHLQLWVVCFSYKYLSDITLAFVFAIPGLRHAIDCRVHGPLTAVRPIGIVVSLSLCRLLPGTEFWLHN